MMTMTTININQTYTYSKLLWHLSIVVLLFKIILAALCFMSFHLFSSSSLSVSHERDRSLSANDGGKIPSSSLRRHRSWSQNENCNLEETGRRLASHSDDEVL